MNDWPQVVTFGETFIDNILRGDVFSWHLGGAPVNSAISIAKLGKRVAIISSVGKDYFGEYILETLNRNNIDCRGIVLREIEKTSLAFIFPQLYESAQFLFYRDADLLIDQAQVDKVISEKTSVFYFSTLSFTKDNIRNTLDYALSRYLDTNCIIIYDLNIRTNLLQETSELKYLVKEYLGKTQVVKASLTDVNILLGSSDPITAADNLWEDGHQLLIITLRENGCYYRTHFSDGFISGYEVDTRSGDGIGTGDAFVGGVCAGIVSTLDEEDNYLSGDNLRKILIQANATGAITATAKGANAPNLSLENIKKLIQGKYKEFS